MPFSCAMSDCGATDLTDPSRRFFPFPSSDERSKAWVEVCGSPDLRLHSVSYLSRNARVCDLHFRHCDIGVKKLKKDAVPLPYDPKKESPKQNQSTKTNVCADSKIIVIDVDAEPGTSTGTKTTQNNPEQKQTAAATIRQLENVQLRLKRLQDNQGLIEGVNTNLFSLIDLHIELQKISNYELCSSKLRLFALQLYLTCPAAYKVLRVSLTLPSEKVLRRTNIGIGPITSCNLISCLKAKIKSLKETEKYCTICLKKIPLKRFLFYHITNDKVIGFQNIDGNETVEPATHAYVLMARGLCSKWEQPLAYCFVAENQDSAIINDWLDGALFTFIDAGYNVVALVVDHEDLYEHFRKRIVSFTQPYFSVYDKKIYCIFDLPQLIISLRNTLMAHELQFLDDDGSLVIADWATIQALYSSNCGSDNYCLLVPKLTKAHINPNETEKKELKYAAQVFSKSVSDALYMESTKRLQYDSKIQGTRKLAAIVNNVFDILNSSAINHHNICKNAFTGEPYQMKAIRRFMEFLTNVKPNDCDFEDSSFNCIYGLRITIMSFSIILRDLLPKGITSLVTHKFNLDGIDRFFDSVRRKSKSAKPTALQFFINFRKSFIVELMKHPKRALRVDPLEHFIKTVDFKQLKHYKLRSEEFKKTIEVSTVDYRFELPTNNTFLYICWYLLKKCFETHMCDLSSYYIWDHSHLRTYDWNHYIEPPKVFVDYIITLDNAFNKHFGNKLSVGLGTGILLVLRTIDFNKICNCFPNNYLRRLFVRMRIFQIFRYNNRNFQDSSFCFTTTDHHRVD